MMTSLPLSIDQEKAADLGESFNGIWLSQGRWMAYILYQYILPVPVLPYFTAVLFGLCAVISYFLVLISCNRKFDLVTTVSFISLIAFPIWSCILEFASNAAAAGVALTFCGFAAFLLVNMIEGQAKHKWALMTAQIALVTMATATYQAFIFVYLVMGLAVLILRSDIEKEKIGLFITISVVSVAAVILQLSGQTIVIWWTGYDPKYIAHFFQPQVLFHSPVMVMDKSVRSIIGIYAGSRSVYGAPLWSSSVIIALAAAAVFSRPSLTRIVLFFAVLLAPFPLVVFAGGSMPLRTFLDVPIVMWVCTIIALEGHLKGLRIAAIAAVALLGLQSVAAISQYQANRELVGKFDQSTAGALYQRIAEVADVRKPQKVDFFGWIDRKPLYPIALGSSSGGSFFQWGLGSPSRMVSYMRVLGYRNMVAVSHDRHVQLRSSFASMPSWPAPGSVRKFEDVVLIKLGDRHDYW
jgi:hypothetical protein